MHYDQCYLPTEHCSTSVLSWKCVSDKVYTSFLTIAALRDHCTPVAALVAGAQAVPAAVQLCERAAVQPAVAAARVLQLQQRGVREDGAGRGGELDPQGWQRLGGRVMGGAALHQTGEGVYAL